MGHNHLQGIRKERDRKRVKHIIQRARERLNQRWKKNDVSELDGIIKRGRYTAYDTSYKDRFWAQVKMKGKVFYVVTDGRKVFTIYAKRKKPE